MAATGVPDESYAAGHEAGRLLFARPWRFIASAPSMEALARAYGAVRYGNLDATPADAEQAWRHVDAVRAALDRATPFLSRLRARVDPSTLRRQPEPAGWSLRRSSSTND